MALPAILARAGATAARGWALTSRMTMRGNVGQALASRLAGGVLRTEVLAGGKELAEEMRKRVPRETGELESEIVVRPLRQGPGVFAAGVGVPADSPAHLKAVMTEYDLYPSHNPRGEPGRPRTRWPAKSKAGATMPWARQSVLIRRRFILRRWRVGIAKALRRGR